MRSVYLVFCVLVLVASVVCEQNRPEVVESRPVGVIYLMQLLNRPINTKNDVEISSNSIPTEYPIEKENSKFFLALAPPRSEPKENREKRSPTKKGYGGYGGYGGHGGNGCNVCQGGGGYYPSGGGYSSGGSFSHAQASASSSSFSGGHYG